MNKKLATISIITTIILVIGIIGVTVLVNTVSTDDTAFLKKENKILTEELKSETKENTEVFDFVVNLKGDMEHGDVLTINGIVPNPNSSVTGMIYRGEENGVDLTVVIVFQLVSDDDGFYTKDVVINDDYLWEKNAIYTISIQNGGKYKTLEFSRDYINEFKPQVKYYQEKSVILDQKLTINVSKSLDGDKLSIWGTSNKSNYPVKGAIYIGDIDYLRIVHAFLIASDNDGYYEQTINISKWEKGSYTISVSSDEEQKQIKITR